MGGSVIPIACLRFRPLPLRWRAAASPFFELVCRFACLTDYREIRYGDHRIVEMAAEQIVAIFPCIRRYLCPCDGFQMPFSALNSWNGAITPVAKGCDLSSALEIRGKTHHVFRKSS